MPSRLLRSPVGRQLLAVGALLWMATAACDRHSDAAAGSEADAREAPDAAGGSSSSKNCECRRPDSFADAVERVRPAVVNLYAADESGDTRRDRPHGHSHDRLRKLVPDERLVRSLGSGIVVESSGLVVTNHHVLEGIEAVRARLLDGRWFETELVGSDPKTDIALLRLVDATDLPTAPLGDSSDLRVGDWVVAIGNPLGLDSTVTVGIASGIGRSDLPVHGEMRYQDFIQTDASINPGNSGGPLVDADGNVVGLNTAISAEGHGIGFAIPSEMVERVIPRLQEGGSVARSWLGLYVDALPNAVRRELDVGTSGGVLVTGVVDGGPAARAGLQEGDVIVRLDGARIEDVDHISWLAGHLPTDDDVPVAIQRGSTRTRLKLSPTAPPDGDAN